MTYRREGALLRSATSSLNPGHLLRVPAGIPGMDEPVIEVLGIELQEVGIGTAVAGLTIGTPHLNARGTVQGGLLTALADAAAGWATEVADGVSDYATVQLNANLLGACIEGDQLRASARAVHVGRRTCVCSVDVMRLRDAAPIPRLVATFQCTQLLTEAPRTV